jgi:electron transfer flavoprotein beta subunit
MKILIGIKHVPDTETKIKLASDGASIDETGVKWIISPYDEFAVEEALKIKEAKGEGEVVLVCAGPEEASTTLRQGLAMGADRAVLVQDERFSMADGLTRARAIAAVAREESPDLVLMGKQGVGTDENQTGPMLAELLDMPHVTAVSKLEINDGTFTAWRDVEGGTEVLEGSLPAVLAADKGLNEPRYASLKGIMQAKKKPIDTKAPADVGMDVAELGDARRVVWESMELPPARQAGRILDGEVDDQVKELVRMLREEEKVI